MSERPFHLLFVCSGNTCRSPLAEAIARREVELRGWDVGVSSAGTDALSGSPASDGSIESGRSVGLDLDAHRSTPLTAELVQSADLILTMSTWHLERVLMLGGQGRSAMLSGFAEGHEDGLGWSIPDPFGAGLEVYLETLRVLEELVPAALRRLEPANDGEDG